jgi:Fe-S-cluster containining protein
MAWSRGKRSRRRAPGRKAIGSKGARLKAPGRENGSPELWRCISGCGSCCRLDPALRPEALEALSPAQQSIYQTLVGPDGWCRHYDTGGQRCRIYASRPDFCRIDSLVALFGGTPEGESEPAIDGNALAIACCKQQIRCETGGRGRVMRRFRQAIRRPR